jgi:hypothetical protein
MENLRFSGLPFCPIRWLAGAPVNTAKSSAKSLRFAFYTRIGTVVHDVFQSVLVNLEGELPSKLELIADWHCAKCKKVTSAFSLKPESCPVCRHRVEFREHEIDINFGGKVRALGHVDCILRVTRPGGKTCYLILDFKTTSVGKLNKKTFDVSSTYTHQIKSYAAAVSFSQNVEVASTSLIYIARDSPHRFKIHTELFSAEDQIHHTKRLRRYTRQLEVVREATSMEDILPLIKTRPCKSNLAPEYADCNFASLCAGKDSSCTKLVASSLDKLEASGRLPVITLFTKNGGPT